MICLSVVAPDLVTARAQVAKCEKKIGLIELRVDHLKVFDSAELVRFCKESPLPLILTLRSKKQGGEFEGTSQQRRVILMELLTLQPTYLDLEWGEDELFLEKLTLGNTKVILSWHGFLGEGGNNAKTVAKWFPQMKRIPAALYKIVFEASNALDPFALWSFLDNERKQGVPILGICSGTYGQSSRVLSALMGNSFTYACADNSSQAALGQMSVDELTSRYGYHKLTPSSSLFGLIGERVSSSPSHITHNAVFQSGDWVGGQSGVYLKFAIQLNELKPLLTQAKKRGFKGLSVTMPYKEVIIPLLDEVDPYAKKLGAVNTIVFRGKKLVGYNTDGLGALNAIEQIAPVRNKKVCVLGAGGTARAVVGEALRRGASVLVCNRAPEKAEEIARLFGCRGGAMSLLESEVREGYDVLINCTSVGMSPDGDQLPIDPALISPGSIVLDVVSRFPETPLLREAKALGCHTVSGREMFFLQAVEQCALWFGEERVNRPRLREVMSSALL